MYNLTGTRTGLPGGTVWGFSVPGAGIGYTLTNASQFLYVLTGTYDIFPQAVSGYYAQPYQFNVQSATQVTIAYTNVSAVLNATGFTATFVETGLPPGTTWGLIIQGHLYDTTNTSITFIDIPQGTYQYGVAGISGYSSIKSGNFTTGLQNTTIYITFVRTTGPSWYLYSGIGAAVGFAIGAAIMYSRHRKP